MFDVLLRSDKELLTKEILRDDYNRFVTGNRIASIAILVFMVIGIVFFLTFLLLALRKRKSTNERTRRLAKTWMILMAIGIRNRIMRICYSLHYPHI